MFRKNTTHLQPALISAVSELTEKQRSRLQSSWAATFYKEFFIGAQSFKGFEQPVEVYRLQERHAALQEEQFFQGTMVGRTA